MDIIIIIIGIIYFFWRMSNENTISPREQQIMAQQARDRKHFNKMKREIYERLYGKNFKE